ncbi:zinc ribbon domain-containing protein [Natrinema amylolyticum]|uniref:zinc ribbon domain-containing protein n=1 Tax=Natrinema amylolyticum TaxID=2878679 RepID=UPI001CFAFB4B|nr:zinc ribbon domain-containing protein [Natrinema amylolyticum]
MTWLRALLAAGLSVIMPGAGHVLVRDWLRAALFAGLFLSVSALFLPIDQLAAAGPITSVDDINAYADVMAEETDAMTQFFLSFIALFAAIDATFRALGHSPGGTGDTEGLTCPECGKEIDEDLEFCHWCTARLDPVEPDAETNDV